MSKLEIPSAEFTPELVSGSVKTAMKDAGAKSADLWKVHPSKLRVIEGFNGRIRTSSYEEHVQNIKQSIIENGYYPDKPLAGYVAKEGDENVIYVTEGHTRHEAVQLAIAEGHEIEAIPVVVKPAGTSVEDLTVALVTSNEGRPFTTYEKSLMIKRLIGMGMDEDTIAKRLMMTKKQVENLLVLAGAPKQIRDWVIADKISATLAIDELQKHGAKAVERLKKAIETAASKGKKKASAKHVEDKPAKAKKAKAAAEPADDQGGDATPADTGKSIDAADVLADATACNINLGSEETRAKILKFAATLLERFGIEVFSDESAGEDDPAADL